MLFGHIHTRLQLCSVASISAINILIRGAGHINLSTLFFQQLL